MRLKTECYTQIVCNTPFFVFQPVRQMYESDFVSKRSYDPPSKPLPLHFLDQAALSAQLITGEIRGCTRGLGRFPNERKAAGYIPRHCSHRM